MKERQLDHTCLKQDTQLAFLVCSYKLFEYTKASPFTLAKLMCIKVL